MGYLKQLTRRKNLSETINEDSQLGKVLNTIDLTAIGVGCTLGVGIYVLPGAVAKYVAGPGVIYSFFWAALTSILAGLCFAEFGARVPKAGSAYTYSYVTIGEFVAFIIGWNLIMEYVIGTASVAKGLSVYIDSMLGGTMEAFYRQLFEMKDTLFLSDYIDIFAFVISMVITTGLAVGLKESMTLNNFLTFINVSVIIFVVVAGSFKGDWSNWSIPASEVPAWAGTGGFLPYGMIGTVAGAATCFFGYVGFDSISASGEEVKNPQKAIPLSIILSITIVFFAYFGVSAVLTLMWPYYLQDPDAPLPYVFEQVGWPWAKWIVAVGGIFGLLASLIAGMFPLPRIVYAMANDGLLFKRLGHVHQKFKTPVFGTFVAGLITGVMAAAFKLKQLVDLMSIATLLAYTIVAACVLLLRYREETETSGPVTHEYVEQTPLVPKELRITCKAVLFQMFNRSSCAPTRISSAVVVVQTILFCIYSTCLAFMTVYLQPYLLQGDSRVSIGCSIFVALMFTSVISISCQPPSRQTLSFKVPLVPLIPCLSIFLNIYLMVLMDGPTWIRFLMWLAVGLLIYFSYGIYHSSERRKDQYVEYKTLITTDEETTA